MFTEYSEPLRVRNGGSRLCGGVILVRRFPDSWRASQQTRSGVSGRLIAKVLLGRAASPPQASSGAVSYELQEFGWKDEA